ncbi:MAG: hypothetical protein M0R39_13275 [Prolixibacteraceae bacterium]|nr:hypothetical protein [Prolixibacteraceae bacterium]
MVRLGEQYKAMAEAGKSSFNSTMVRLGGRVCKGYDETFGKVSIPRWFDWEQIVGFVSG